MKALVFDKPLSMEVKEVPKPEIHEGEALIKVKYIGICGTDLHVYNGHHPTATFPLIPGHEFVGELAEICGEGSEDFEIGDHVVAQELLTCGRCDACAKGEDNVCENLKIIGVHADGGFAEYVKVKTKKMIKIPKEASLETAALVEPLAVAVHDVHMSGLKVGESVHIIGGGPIGMLIAMVARHAGASKVVISEVMDFRRKYASDIGFITVNPLDADYGEQLNALTDGHGFDVSFEAAGVPSAITTCVDYTKNTGTIVQIAMTKEPYKVDTGKIFAKELRIQGVRIHAQYSFAVATRMAVSGCLGDDFPKLISKVFDFDHVKDAFDYAATCKEAFKTIVKVSD